MPMSKCVVPLSSILELSSFRTVVKGTRVVVSSSLLSSGSDPPNYTSSVTLAAYIFANFFETYFVDVQFKQIRYFKTPSNVLLAVIPQFNPEIGFPSAFLIKWSHPDDVSLVALYVCTLWIPEMCDHQSSRNSRKTFATVLTNN